MKKVFAIQGATDARPDIVLCEWGAEYCCIATLDASAGRIAALEYLQLDGKDEAAEVHSVLDTLKEMGNGTRRLLFTAAFAPCILFPKKMYRAGNESLEALYDGPFQKTTNHIHEWQVIAEFGIPQNIYTGVRNNFGETEFFHAYTVDLKAAPVVASTIHAHFSPNAFRVLVREDGALKLAQTYSYTSPLDVVYYLLKIRSELGLNVEETAVVLSGLVEKDSALYSELHHYFDLHFYETTSLEMPESGYPAHYFAHFLNLVKCAS